MYFRDEYGNFGEATILLDGMVELTKEEYDDYIIKYKAEQKQQMIVEEQADLLNRRTAADLTKAEKAYIEARLEEISDYWDSLEGTVATYAE